MKNYRHQKIMDIIRSSEVETQEELARLLREAGFTVTQATVSRDIKQLNLKKIPHLRADSAMQRQGRRKRLTETGLLEY